MNRLHRVDGPHCYRLMAVEMHGEQWIGQTAGGNSLLKDIAAYRSAICKPLYAVFVRPVIDSRAAQEKGA
ncbi:hypothetical protein [Sphingomonas sp. MA1305]|uniref:hypothetical protein n=1 Tax=Sphingomonas sp. MA1305 TaxID=2479204 RepID=UPI0018DF06F5|nr:hypothetical protein [Sphingomonas sp. MA1305]